MSCPTPGGMEALLAHRFDPEAPEPAQWPELAAHLDECAACRRRALAVDPSLLFGGPGRREVPGAASPEEMIQAVTAMRRAERVERVERVESPRHRRGWAAAAGIALMALSFGALDRSQPEAAPGESLRAAVEPAVAVATDVYGRDEMSGSTLEDIPLVEDPGPGFRVRETDAEGGSLAFVYQTDLDEGLLGG